ncbi:neuroligin 5 isoform X1 [Apis mellifera]|uniref:Neuroligin 5 isoform X1 n=1 Tax=Apis mellifera TaxID=7460 RepID=A0A7M7GSC7_APIME|nr:neuroligin 5 isoform X1 [Apis mellifera]XP_006561627.1 neuroligin 5 isoform X1 [Apis mellifera]XP_016769337.1 neuroligin 5 isoform X1 [Apis mellifera]XP_016769339.1 neuroligin 5 isoform X1 [Apis mellifera]|eukprot:XP_006561626.1 neuroligin 5 isoform X1 [Apis mellifera]
MPLPCQPAARKRPLATRSSSGSRTCLALIIAIVLLGRGGSRAATQIRYASRIVETKSGQIRGILQDLNSKHLDPVEVFRGIPYAAPPVGDLRFRPPISPIPWDGIKLADSFGAVCPQHFPDISNDTAALLQMPLGRYQQLKRLYMFLTNQSEDCLFLNLYIPGSGSRGLEAPYAVMVYVHGESFEWGTGNIYDGSVLASAGHVIVITLNYRLGILGFLRTRPYPDRTPGSGGNLALKDIAMGLRWVRENIAAFGGDPTKITLIGHDTGAALVNLLLLAPYGKGLFHRVVLSSGSALSPWASVHDPNDLRLKVGEQIGCSTENDEDIADCLRGVPLRELMAVELPEIRFVPRIGPGLPVDQNNPDPGLDMERASDTFIKVPLILGVSTTESNLDFNENDIQYGFEEDHRNRILRTFIRNAYVYHLNEIFSAVRNEYTDWDKPILHPIIIRDSTMEALSDGHTVAPLMRIAFYHARRGAKTYFYHFSHQTKESGMLQITRNAPRVQENRLGSIRGEDISYIFGLPLVGGGAFFSRNYSRQDQTVAEAVLTFFTNFAKTGNPNEPHKIESVDYGTPKEKTRYRGLTWEQYETGTQQYLTIAMKPKMKSHYRGHKMAVWLNLIPQLHRPGDDDVSMRHHHFRERGDHFYAGPVRDEWYTPLPLVGTTKASASSTTACSTTTGDDSITEDITPILDDSEDDAELLQRLASRHYYSTTTALAITVGVGCILLVLNMLIFAGIYYQRDRDKKRAAMDCTPNGQESLPMTTRSSIKAPDSPRPAQEPPPSYTTLARSPSIQEHQQIVQSQSTEVDEQFKSEQKAGHGTSNAIHKDPIPPKPPTRTTSSLSTASGTNTIKKRVQIQEISV